METKIARELRLWHLKDVDACAWKCAHVSDGSLTGGGDTGHR